MQVSCRQTPPPANPAHASPTDGERNAPERAGLHKLGAFLAFAVLSLAAVDPSAAARPQAPTTTASPALVTDQAAQWLSRQLSIPANRIRIQAPDPRLRMPQCGSPVQFDAPFSALTTVRVRCAEPVWQLFLRAQWEAEEAPQAQSGSALAGAAQGQTGARPVAGTLPGLSSPGFGAANSPRRAVAPVRPVPRGALLTPASVDWVLVPAREADSSLITDPAMLEQTEAVRELPAGQPLRQTDIRAAVLVRQGQSVLLTVGQGNGFTVTVRLEALQDGRLGDRVMLRNMESGRTVSGIVTGLNAARGA